MNKYYQQLKRLYMQVLNSIAFRPTIITLTFFVLATILVYADLDSVSGFLEKYVEFLLIKGNENARAILSTLLGGMISLTVFSFTMVMLVLSQASSSFTPRVIPGVLNDKSNQTVLGFYIGTIIYCLVMMINIGAGGEDSYVPRLGLFLAMIFGVVSLALFIIFINNISQTIMVDNISEEVYRSTLKRLKVDNSRMKGMRYEGTAPEIHQWHECPSPLSGFFRGYDTNYLIKLCKKENIIIAFLNYKGNYVLKGTPLFKTNENLSEKKELLEQICDRCEFYTHELIDTDYVNGFKQISEIAIKALSPGINDPGTALKVIDFMTHLYQTQMEYKDRSLRADDEGNLRIIEKEMELSVLLYEQLSGIRHYAREDARVLARLFSMLRKLIQASDREQDILALAEHVQTVAFEADKHLCNPADRNRVNDELIAINQLLPQQLTVEVLAIA